MMISFLLLSASAPLKPPALFDAAVQARIRLKSYAAHIDVDTALQGKRDRRTYDVSSDGSKLLMRLRQPATTTIERSDRTYELLNDRLVAYDSVANERLQRADTMKGTLLTRLTGALGPVDDSLAIVVDPTSLKALLARYRPFTDWRVSRVNGDIQIIRASGGTRTRLCFGGSTPLLKEVEVDLKGSHLHWTFSFSPGARLALNIPSDAKRVSAFSERPAPPKFVTKEAEHVVERMMSAYQHLRNGEIEVEDDGAVSHLWLSGSKLREDRAGFEWAYNGSILSALNKRTGKFYQGKTIRVTLSEFIVPMGGEVDPMLRRVLAHRAAFGDLFPPEAKVALQGTISVGGVPAQVLKVSNATTSLSVFVRTDNHFIDSVEAETYDKGRRMMTTNTRRYKYVGLDQAPPASKFVLDPGSAKVLPLPKVKGLNE